MGSGGVGLDGAADVVLEALVDESDPVVDAAGAEGFSAARAGSGRIENP